MANDKHVCDALPSLRCRPPHTSITRKMHFLRCRSFSALFFLSELPCISNIPRMLLRMCASWQYIGSGAQRNGTIETLRFSTLLFHWWNGLEKLIGLIEYFRSQRNDILCNGISHSFLYQDISYSDWLKYPPFAPQVLERLHSLCKAECFLLSHLNSAIQIRPYELCILTTTHIYD